MRVPAVLAMVVLLLAVQPARAAFWQEFADLLFGTDRVCKDGIYFGLADYGPYSYHVFAFLDDSSAVIDNQRVTIGPGAVDDPNVSAPRSHSGFFKLAWDRELEPGTPVTLDFVPEEPASPSGDPRVFVADCVLEPTPRAYLPLLTKP